MTKNKEGVVFGNTYTRTFSRSEVLLTQNNAEHILFMELVPLLFQSSHADTNTFAFA